MSVQNLTVTEDEDGMRLDRWFKRRVPNLSLSHLNKICRKGEVRVSGKRVEGNSRLEAGQIVRVPPLDLAPEKVNIRSGPNEADARALKDMILFEDAGLMVLNKPFGLAVQGGSGTLHHIDGMLESMPNKNGERPKLVHRLDKDTAGVLLIAKTRKMAADLGEAFRARQTKKIYWALVRGVPKPIQGRISLFLAKGEGMGLERGEQRPKALGGRNAAGELGFERMRVAKHGDEDAQHSVTYYTLVEKAAQRVSWLSMKPITGRTHQLRAHAEAIGNPIIGDPKYGLLAKTDPRRTDPLQMLPDGMDNKLHLLARRLILPHPKGGMIDVTAPLPPHMAKSWDMLGFDAKSYDPILDAPED